jgi:phosphatidylcholine synthase
VDGSHLDDLVDYLTFVFVPAFLLYHAGRLPVGWGMPVVFAVLVSSAIAFARSDAKTSDHFFTGFPSYWNIVALYMVLLGLSPWLNAVVLLGLCALIFVRIGYVYPSRTPTLRAVTLALGSAWGALLLYQTSRLPEADTRLSLISLAFPVYYTVLSLILHARRR